MRYLLFPGEEGRFLAGLRDDRGLVPLAPVRPADFLADMRVPERTEGWSPDAPWRYEYVFWASGHGPLRRLGDRPPPETAQDRVALHLNRDAAGDWAGMIDTERTPVVTWSRPRWLDDARRWVIPSRLGGMRAPVRSYAPDYRALLRSIERDLRRGGRTLNSWDLPGADADGRHRRPRNTRSYTVSVWPDAARWLDAGGRIHHWDS